MSTIQLIASILAQTGTDYGAIVAQCGFGGMVLIIVSRWLERIDHSLKGLSMALWSDLASRPSSTPYIKDMAQKQITRMENERGR